MALSFRWLLLVACLLPVAALAQPRLMPNPALSEPDQELEDFSGRYHGTHVLSARLRGVQAAGNTVYWVSTNGRQLSAYQAGKLLWTTDVAGPFLAELPAARISSLVLSTELLFVSMGRRGMAEVDRKTGQVSAKYFDRDPGKLVAEPK